MSFRKRSVELRYILYRHRTRNDTCVFCAFKDINKGQVLRTEKYFWVVINIFPYNVWDHLPVKDHLMIIPRRHTDAIHHFTVEEQAEYAKLLTEYDNEGYSVYARASTNIFKTITHQHTHLLRLGNKPKSFLLYLHKPYIALHR
jgi:diadenosine tetraphosphate (Ap4A) HIT family hydrolase